ncbi:extracellular exo-polygalacturonase [Colletotrichum kahawae]|uniref:galacturonan 1,4-alpha-galacturonidase n=1 Tax=Colletotrichum kahawae TaxID=34407 RepID=A0AAD9Y0M4_COLKA|nr:extracellular exo-polygalacturonase [Colletotrichum kahawae]
MKILVVWLVGLAFGVSVSGGGVEVAIGHGRPQCTVTADGDKQSDVDNILNAFDRCGNSGSIIFPENQKYWIDRKLKPHVKDVQIQWRGEWTFSDNIIHWRSDSYFIEFQNHRAAFILTGDGIHIDGHGTGGIHGNGNTWYTSEAGETVEGRPMPFVFWNVSDVSVRNFHIKQPQFWAYNIMNGTDMVFQNISSNATSTKAPGRYNWVQNTDGFDLEDITGHGGNGISIGSLGQYLEDSSVENVTMNSLQRSSIDLRIGVYIKTCIGELAPQDHYESAGEPRGGGWGRVRNITFSNVYYENVNNAPSINQNNGNNGSFAGTSNMDVSDINFLNFTGILSGCTNRVSLSCSATHKCGNIKFEDIGLLTSSNITTTCTGKWTLPDAVTGLPGC